MLNEYVFAFYGICNKSCALYDEMQEQDTWPVFISIGFRKPQIWIPLATIQLNLDFMKTSGKKNGAEIIIDCKDKDNKKTYFWTPTFRRRKEHLGPVKTNLRTVAGKKIKICIYYIIMSQRGKSKTSLAGLEHWEILPPSS